MKYCLTSKPQPKEPAVQIYRYTLNKFKAAIKISRVFAEEFLFQKAAITALLRGLEF